MGATVIDRATVDLLRSQIRTASAQRNATAAQNKILEDQLVARNELDEQLVPRFAEGTLTGVPVVILDVQGGGVEKNVDQLTLLLKNAGANVQGQIDFTRGLRLDKGDDTVTKLAAQLGLSGSLQVDDVRKNSLTKLAQWLANPTPGTVPADGGAAKTPLDVMKGLGLLQQNLSGPLSPNTRFIVVSSAAADVGNDQVAAPFTSALTLAAGQRVLAAEPGVVAKPAATPPVPAVREVFLSPLRTDPALKDKLTTVDNIEDVYGRVALIYALKNLPNLTGHYGVGAHASELVPKS
jgi:hypothetical protein